MPLSDPGPPARAAGAGAFRSSFLRYASNEAINSVSTIVGVVVFTRLVPPAEFGAYSVALAGSAFAAAVAGEWLQASVVRVGAGLPTTDHRALHRALGRLAAGVALVVLLPALAFAVVWQGRTGRLTALAGLNGALTLGFLAFTAYLQAIHEPGRFARLRSAYAILRVLLGVVLATLTHSAEGLLLGGVLALTFLLPLALRAPAPVPAPSSAPIQASVPLAQRMRGFGLPLIGWYLASQMLNLSDRFFLQLWAGSEEVGYYAVSYALVMGGTVLLLQPLLLAGYPQLVRAWEQGGPASARQQLGRLLELLAVVIPLLLVGLPSYGQDLLRILAPASYRAPVEVIGLLTLGIVCWYLGLFLQKVLELQLRSTRLLASLATAAGANLVANLLLIPRWGMTGAAAATAAGYLLYVILVLLASPAELRVRPSTAMLVDSVLAAALFLGLAWAFRQAAWSEHLLFRLLVAAPAAGLGYLGFLGFRGHLGGLMPILRGRA